MRFNTRHKAMSWRITAIAFACILWHIGDFAAASDKQAPMDAIDGTKAPELIYPKPLSGELEFRGGARYIGDYKEYKDKTQVLDGKGEFFGTNFNYKGNFKDGKKHGRGSYTWSNGDNFEGDFVEDQISGSGKWKFAGGDIYEGEVRHGLLSGTGTLTTKDGDKFKGKFIDGVPSEGVYEFMNGSRLEGDLRSLLDQNRTGLMARMSRGIVESFNALPVGAEDSIAWKAIRQTEDLGAYKELLSKFPKSDFADAAHVH